MWLQLPSALILEPPKIKSDTVSTVSPSISHEVMGPDAMIFIFLSGSSLWLEVAFFHPFLSGFVYLYPGFFNHSLVLLHLGFFRILVIVSSAAMMVGVQYLENLVFPGSMPRHGMAGSHGTLLLSV